MKGERINKDEFLFIRAGSDFTSKGIRQDGYRVEKPFYEKGLFLRILREGWFRLKLPGVTLFYNKDIRNFDGTHIIVYDPQITREYLQWLKGQHKDKKIVFFYGNMVGRARHITPDRIPEGIQAWTYERSDSEKYKIGLNTKLCYHTSFCREKKEPEYDLLFVGRDKGRMDFLRELEQALQAAGMKIFFRIVGNTRLEKKKHKRYGLRMEYEEICELIARSKAILNVALPGQEGITVRDCEAICNNVKLITTNSAIVNRSFYDPANILVIDGVDAKQIKKFLEQPMNPYNKELQSSLTMENWLLEML